MLSTVAFNCRKNLANGGIYPSRLLIAPQDPALPLVDSIIHLQYSDNDTEIIPSGLLDGLLVVTDANIASLEDRMPCAKIRRGAFSSTPHAAYEPNLFDMRPPLTFAWTASSNITVQSPTQRNTSVTFNDGATGFVNLVVTDADGVVRSHRRNGISRTNP